VLASKISITDYIAPPPTVPTFVTLAQARQQLRTLGLFAQVDTAANGDTTSAVYDAWNYGNGVTRNEVLATFIQTTFAWTDTQMDTLMIATAAIQL
jgi:hypothetical protein